MTKAGILFLLFSLSLQAKITILAPQLTVDLNRSVQKLASCGPNIPGTECIYQCYNIDNQSHATYYSCDLQANGTFVEKIITSTDSTLYTGNTLSATDYRSVWVYPYQTVQVCFNYGKETAFTPSQPYASWVFKNSQITASSNCNGSATPPYYEGGFAASTPATGELHTRAIDLNNNIYCWGANHTGQLGNGTTVDSVIPVPVNTSGVLKGLTIKNASSGLRHTCALASDNHVYCWGRNGSGELGDGTMIDSTVGESRQT